MMHLVVYLYEVYHDPRSLEHKIEHYFSKHRNDGLYDTWYLLPGRKLPFRVI